MCDCEALSRQYDLWVVTLEDVMAQLEYNDVLRPKAIWRETQALRTLQIQERGTICPQCTPQSVLKGTPCSSTPRCLWAVRDGVVLAHIHRALTARRNVIEVLLVSGEDGRRAVIEVYTDRAIRESITYPPACPHRRLDHGKAGLLRKHRMRHRRSAQ